ncbi:MAG: hypothetical protein ACLR8U_00430 [Oscillospiraceae bacterium]
MTNFETNQKTAVYDMEKAAGKDPYEMFLSGSVSLLTIENPSAKTDKELVIFRDSFASSLAPLLIDGYTKITLIDIRYLPSARLGSFVTFDNQDVLFLYSVPGAQQQQRPSNKERSGRQALACLPLFAGIQKN